MAEKFHINGNNEAMPCKAEKRSCKFGDSNHFADEKTAQNESERRLSKENGGSVGVAKKKDSLKSRKPQRKAARGPLKETLHAKEAAINEVTNEELIEAESSLNMRTQRIRFQKDSSPAEIRKTAIDVQRFFSNEGNKNKSIKIDDVHGHGLGVNRVRFNNEDKTYEYGKIRTGYNTPIKTDKNINTVMSHIERDLGYNDEDYSPIDWDA